MSVGSEVRSKEYAGNDVTTDFSTVFYFLDASHLVVSKKVGAGAYEVQLEGVQYTVVMPTSAGLAGTVHMLAAPLTGDTLRIERTVPFTQPTSYRGQGAFSRGVHEDSYDLATMGLQQLNDRLLVVEATAGMVPVADVASVKVSFTFVTGASIADSFPIFVPLPVGFVPDGWSVFRTVDGGGGQRGGPSDQAANLDAVGIDAVPVEGGLSVIWASGLEENNEDGYTITLLVLQDV